LRVAHGFSAVSLFFAISLLMTLAPLDLAALVRALFATPPAWNFCYLGFSKAAGATLELTSLDAHRLCAVSGCYS
jgi:hypothetical protein